MNNVFNQSLRGHCLLEEDEEFMSKWHRTTNMMCATYSTNHTHTHVTSITDWILLTPQLSSPPTKCCDIVQIELSRDAPLNLLHLRHVQLFSRTRLTAARLHRGGATHFSFYVICLQSIRWSRQAPIFYFSHSNRCVIQIACLPIRWIVAWRHFLSCAKVWPPYCYVSDTWYFSYNSIVNYFFFLKHAYLWFSHTHLPCLKLEPQQNNFGEYFGIWCFSILFIVSLPKPTTCFHYHFFVEVVAVFFKVICWSLSSIFDNISQTHRMERRKENVLKSADNECTGLRTRAGWT